MASFKATYMQNLLSVLNGTYIQISVPVQRWSDAKQHTQNTRTEPTTLAALLKG